MIIENLLPEYKNRLLSSPISSFGELCDCRTWTKYAINIGQLKENEWKPLVKKTHGGGSFNAKPSNIPKSMPNHVPSSWNLNEFYHFHQKFGHKTDKYLCLKNEIQDIIYDGTIAIKIMQAQVQIFHK